MADKFLLPADDVDDDFAFADDIEVDDADASVSREFLNEQFSGLDSFCQRPWRTLKITLTSQTRICCDFFTQLPVFDFPDAKDFHKPTGMWNHPYMQHLRSTMGTDEEVPFCTLCLTKDKRSPVYAEERAKAISESFETYRKFEELSNNLSYKGTLGAYEGRLQDFTLNVGQKWPPLKPFLSDRSSYRRLVTKSGFQQHGRVLMVGCNQPALAPFLAEACDHLTLVDRSMMLASRAAKLCSSFGLKVSLAEYADKTVLDLEDGAFDAVWFNAQMLAAPFNARILGEVTRVLAQSGRLHIYRVPGPGRLFEEAVARRGEFADRLIDALETGPQPDGSLFFSSEELRPWLRRFNLRLDVAMPMSKQYSNFDADGAAVTASPHGEAIRRLAARYMTAPPGEKAADADGPRKLERTVGFCCFKR